MKNLRQSPLFFLIISLFTPLMLISCDNLGEIIEDDVTTSYTVYIDSPQDVVSPRSTTLNLRIGNVYSASQLISLCSPALVRTGYKITELCYWSNPYETIEYSTIPFYIHTDSDGTITSVEVTQDGAVLYVGDWAEIEYSVRFVGNGGKTSAGETSYTQTDFEYNSAKNLVENSFSRNGYDFTKWNTQANGSGKSYSDKESVENLSSTDGAVVYLYAQWEAEGCVTQIDDGLKVSYNASSSSMTFTSSVGTGIWVVNGEILSSTPSATCTITYADYVSGQTYILYFFAGSQALSATFTIP